jgi:hypothetical protein
VIVLYDFECRIDSMHAMAFGAGWSGLDWTDWVGLGWMAGSDWVGWDVHISWVGVGG